MLVKGKRETHYLEDTGISDGNHFQAQSEEQAQEAQVRDPGGKSLSHSQEDHRKRLERKNKENGRPCRSVGPEQRECVGGILGQVIGGRTKKCSKLFVEKKEGVVIKKHLTPAPTAIVLRSTESGT